MAMKHKRPIVVSIGALSKRKQKKVVKKMTRAVVKDKKFRRALRKSDSTVSKPAITAVATAAVKTALGLKPVKAGKTAIPKKKSALEVYSGLVSLFSKERKKFKKRRKKHLKAARNRGFDPKTGFYKLQKLERIDMAKHVEPYKPKK